VFTLARAIVGVHHAAFAVLLMVGILAFAAPTPDFGPAILALPFTVFALVNLWRALGERKRTAWFALALNLGLLLLTTYAGLILAAAIGVFLATRRRGRRALRSTEPWFASIIIVAVLFPHLLWFDLADRPFDLLVPAVTGSSWLKGLSGFVAMLLLSHVGLMLLIALGARWQSGGKQDAPVFVRSSASPFGERFVYFFAAVPALFAASVAGLSAEPPGPGSIAPYIALSGLAAVVLSGNAIFWPRPRLLATAWALLLTAPPLGVAAAVIGLPWLGVPGAGVDRPAAAIGRFFAESFTRRTGAPLAIVAGDPGTAALVALGAPGPGRPSLYLDAAPRRSPWVTADDIRRRGAVVVWPSVDTRSEVPPAIAARFPGLVADVPRAFEREVQGRLPLLRIGWGVIRPQTDAGAAKPGR
jgi:4-amino-4-deoxy-L-arabinose transferase-like glycosyltransferase